jgi:TniQ
MSRERPCVNVRLIAPNWTELPPLKLRGVGTPLVESLHSYLQRLYKSVGVSPLRLGRYMGERTDGKIGYTSLSGSVLWQGEFGMARLAQLEELTGMHELRCGTLWAMSEVLSQHISMFGTYRRRWCPKCYEEWNENSYEPLIWSIDLLGHCPNHKCELDSVCPQCKCPQRNDPDINRRLLCCKCGVPLRCSAKSRPHVPFLQWIDDQILQMVEYCSTPRSSPMPWSDYVDFAWGVCANGRGRGKLGSVMSSNLEVVSRHARQCCRRPSVRTLLNLCALQGVEIRDFLHAPREASSPLLINQWSGLNYVPVPSSTQSRRMYMASRYIEDFCEDNPPYFPPMKILLSHLHVQRLAVRDTCPKLYDGYEDRHASQGASGRQAKLRRAYLYALHITKDANSTAKASASIARKVVASGECKLEDARDVVEAVLTVLRFKKEKRLDKFRDETSLRDSFDWVMGRRAECTTGFPWSKVSSSYPR